MIKNTRNINMLNIALHATAYDIAWIIAILTASTSPIWLGPSIVAAITLIQIIWQKVVIAKTKGLATMIGLFLAFGFLFDSLLVWLNIITFSNSVHPLITSPFMLAIWFNFAVFFYTVLMPLSDKYGWLAVLSFIGFPFAYFVGAYFDAATIVHGNYSLIIIGVVYAFVIPMILFIYNTRISSSD